MYRRKFAEKTWDYAISNIFLTLFFGKGPDPSNIIVFPNPLVSRETSSVMEMTHLALSISKNT